MEANTAAKKVCAASRCAADLVKHLAEVHKSKLKFKDTQAISDLQHEMMDGMLKYSKSNAEAKCKEMFTLLYGLESKFEEPHEY